MTGINIIIAMLMFIGISLETSQAIADKRVKIIELAESGLIIEFIVNLPEFFADNRQR